LVQAAAVELLLHDQLLQRIGVESPGPRPRRGDQTVFGEQGAAWSGGDRIRVAHRRRVWIGQCRGPIEDSGYPPAEVCFGVGQCHGEISRPVDRNFAESCFPGLHGAGQPRQRDGPSPVQVDVVFPGEADGSV
jgi:hypothetical protein